MENITSEKIEKIWFIKGGKPINAYGDPESLKFNQIKQKN